MYKDLRKVHNTVTGEDKFEKELKDQLGSLKEVN